MLSEKQAIGMQKIGKMRPKGPQTDSKFLLCQMLLILIVCFAADGNLLEGTIRGSV